MVIVTEITEETEECYCDEESEIQSHLCERFCKFPCLPFETNLPGKFGITALFIYHPGKLIFQTQKINFACWAKKLKLNWNPWPRAKIEIPRSSIDGDIFSRQLSLSLFLRDTILCLVLCYVYYNRSSLVQDNISFKTTSFYYWPVFWRHRTARLWTASTRTDQPLNLSVSF